MDQAWLDELRQRLGYNPKSGCFWWRDTPLNLVNRRLTRTGTEDTLGYVVIGFKRKVWRAHRLAWTLTHGAYPDKGIDHINGKRNDNRLANLRLANQSQNAANMRMRENSKSGYRGVSWSRPAGKWMARIKVDYTGRYLGLYECPHTAAEAYNSAALMYFGEFAALNEIRR